MKKGLTELVLILDRSGSMTGLESDTIGGYNAMLKKQQAVDGECRITTLLFDNTFELLHDRIDIKAVSEMTDKEYQVGGTTALIDAIGMSLHKIDNAQKHTAEEYRAEKVIFVIITDGEENSSREYSTAQVKDMINKRKKDNGWEFIFLGANIDAVGTAGTFGIGADRAVDYIADSEGTSLNFAIMSKTVANFREQGVIEEGAFNEIRDDVKRRGR